MSKYQNYAEKPTEFLALTGYTREEFDALLPHFSDQFYERMRTHRLDGKLRGKRKYSDYRNSPLPTMEDKLFFILNYLKTNNLQTMQGAFFGISQPKANQWIHTLRIALNNALGSLGELPSRKMEDVEFDEKDTLYFHDGAERPIQRPTDSKKQKDFYSGKKKRHTLKNNVVIDASCKIIFLTETVAGKKHDKKLADESVYTLPAGSRLVQDTGFQGFDLDEVTIIQPKKKTRGQKLSDLDKHVNQWVSSLRIRVEHAISGVKRYRIVKDTIRNWKKGVRDEIFETCCGLHNFRLNFRPWRYGSVQLHLFAPF